MTHAFEVTNDSPQATIIFCKWTNISHEVRELTIFEGMNIFPGSPKIIFELTSHFEENTFS